MEDGGYATYPPSAAQWRTLMQRTFGIDVHECPNCGGKFELLAIIMSPAVIQRILTHLRLPSAPPSITEARAPSCDADEWFDEIA